MAVQAEGQLQLGLVGVICAGAVPHLKAGELPIEGVGDIHFGALLKDGLALVRVSVGLEPEQVPQIHGVQRRYGFLRGNRRAGEQKRKRYDVC